MVLKRRFSSPRRAEFRERHLGRAILVYDLDGHLYFNLFGRAVDKIGEHVLPLVELDIGHHIGQRLAKAGGVVLVGDSEGVDLAAARASNPFGPRREACGALGTRMVAQLAAIAALLDVQLVPLERLPVGATLLVDGRERL